MTQTKLEILLVNLGTPSAPTAVEVRRFLAEFLADPMVVDWPRFLWLPVQRGIVLRKRPEMVARLYQSIWSEGGSPLRVQSEALARSLEARLGIPVRAVFRYGTPSLKQELLAAGERAERVIVVPLFPQRTASSSGSVTEEVQLIANWNNLAERVECRALAPDNANYIEALASRVRETHAQPGVQPEHLVISFHGIPARVDRKEKERYSQDCGLTATALLKQLDWEPSRSTICFQSRFGPERWLGPATSDVLRELPSRRICHASVIAPGFLTDGLETLEELGVRGREEFIEAGGSELTLVPAISDHPALTDALAELCSD